MLPFTMISPTALLVVGGTVAGCCTVAALLVLRHLAYLEARLRAVEASPVDGHVAAAWLAMVEQLAGRFTPTSYRQGIQHRLVRAQLADRVRPEQLILLAIALAAGGATLTALTSGVSVGGMLFPLYVVLAAVVSGIWLDRRAVRRRQAVQNSLPATLDLLVLAMEAGLSLDAAIREVVAEWHSAASRELERVAMLTQLGMSRGEALRDIAEALDLETLRRLAGRVNAAERLGSSLLLILRAEAEEARRERRTVASRKIAQAPTKILIPTALLILPVTLIVLLGPTLPQIVRIAGG
jgi:tight adherence protein C